MEPVDHTVLYGDVTCWKCALAHRRADLLRASGHTIQWRAVESQRALPVPGRRRSERESTRVLASLAQFGPQIRAGQRVPCYVTDMVPQTAAAVCAYAEAVVATVEDQVRDLLFAAYWMHGTDIGDPEVLRTLCAVEFMSSQATSDPIARFGYAVAMTREPITGAAWRMIRQWREDWQQLRAQQLPVVTDSSGTPFGDAALRRRADLLDKAPAITDRDQPRNLSPVRDWEPPGSVNPPEAWTSQVGDPWRRAGLIRRARMGG